MDSFCVLLSIFKFVFVLRPTFGYSQNDDVTSELTGADLKLSCKIHEHNSVYWEWWSSDKDDFKTFREYEDQSNRFDGIQSKELIIKNLDTRASGGYRCRYYNSGDGYTEANRKKSNDFWLYVTNRTDSFRMRCHTRMPADGYSWLTSSNTWSNNNEYYTPNLRYNQQTATYRCRYYEAGKQPWYYNQIRVVVTEKPNIREGKKNYIAVSGTSVTLQCHIDEAFPPVTNSSWKKHKTEITKRMPINNVISLTLSSVTEKDSGSYYCYACNAIGCSSVQVDLKAGDKPVITGEKTIIFEEGSNVSLKVSVSSSANYSVTNDSWRYSKWPWDKGTYSLKDLDRKRMSQEDNFYMLDITNVTTSDNGYYTFLIENAIGQSNRTIHLIVWRKPSVVTEQKRYFLAAGSNKHINCTVKTINYAIKNITWFKQTRTGKKVVNASQRLNTNHATIFLSLFPVKREDDGEYVCSGAHDYGKGNLTIVVHVGEPPSVSVQKEYVSKEGGNVFILCNTSSTNNFSSTLYKNNSRISFNASRTFHKEKLGNTQEYHLQSLTKQNAGRYICHANNTYGTGRNETELIILYAIIKGQLKGLKRNMSLNMNCDTNRKGNIKWRFNGETIDDQNTRNLSLQNINRNQTGNFTCENTYSGVTVTSSSVYVYVKDLPLVTPIQLVNIKALVGDDIDVHCGYNMESNPSTVEWSHNDVSFSKLNPKRYNGGTVSVPSLTILQSKTSDSGNYTCKVTNEIGSSYSEVIRVLITEPKEQTANNTGSAIGVTAGILVLVVLLIVAVLYLLRKRKMKERNRNDEPAVRVANDEVQYLNVERRHPSDGISHSSRSQANTSTFVIREENIASNGKCAVETNNDSTYYNSFEAYPTRVKVAELGEYLTKKESSLNEEFKGVPYGLLHDSKCAQAAENKSKNRYKTTFAYDHTRVILHHSSSKSDYINANYIDGFDREKQYLACQGPITSTISDHWDMIWQENVEQIVMLTNLIEGIKAKCERYWPDCSGEMKTGIFSLNLVTEKERATFITREIDVYNKKTSQTRRVVQYHFTAWPDHGTPDPLNLVAFYRRVVADEPRRKIPLLVHCSAGIGRTGTYIGLDAMTKAGNKTGYVDIFNYLKQMRYCRMNMIQTADQYTFLHQALVEMFRFKDRTIRKDQMEDVWRRITADKNPINTQCLYQEFKTLKSIVDETAGKPTVLCPVDIHKNRDKNILPMEKSRVFLVSFDKDRSNYINAVHVPSYRRQRGFIVTQLPLKETAVDFWTMMFDHGSLTIVLILDSEKEANVVYPYSTKDSKIGCFEIDKVQRDDCGKGITEAILNVTRNNTEETITVHVYQIISRCPILPDKLGRLTDLVMKQDTSSDRPITVVSSDGARNCGLFCVFANAVSSMTMDDRVDIFHLSRVAKLHQPAFLSEYDEYIRCHEALHMYFESTNIYANT